ncbi:hypothetical protein V4762_03915, partial [Thermodesulfobium sp. 4217-1]
MFNITEFSKPIGSAVQTQGKTERINVEYIRVSLEYHKDYLTRQVKLFKLFLVKQDKKFKIISYVSQ